MNSPAPLTTLIVNAPAPSSPRYGPVMLRDPS